VQQPGKTLWDWLQLLIVPAILVPQGDALTPLRPYPLNGQ
jgi:hypothetical protein